MVYLVSRPAIREFPGVFVNILVYESHAIIVACFTKPFSAHHQFDICAVVAYLCVGYWPPENLLMAARMAVD